ncbi:MAG: acetylornithine deacetylase [Halioglobus sp.]
MPHSSKAIIDQLQQLVGTPSVSSTDPKWDQGNRAVIDLLANWLSDLGFSTEVISVNTDGSKANLIATLGTGPGGLVLAGHSDTVPFDEGLWKSNPLAITERDQRLYGLGSTDMKGFFPLAIAAASAFKDTPLKQPLIILATADEESSMSGARALANAGKPKARAAIIGEPTGLVPIRMHKGIMMESIRVTGSAGHSSNPDLGQNALEGMHSVIGDLMDYRHELKEKYSDELFEVAYPTLNLGCIHGGDSPNRICGSAELHFDLRMTPRGDNATARAQINSRMQKIAEELSINIDMLPLIKDIEPFEQARDCELIRVAEKLSGHQAEAVAFATEAPFMQQLGMETIVMGPGSIDRAHQPDEYLELDQIEPCIALLQNCIRHYCL